MAISTISVTGLSTFDINSAFNDNGVILLEILFQVGGLGIMMISTAFIIFSKRRITLRQRQLIMTDMNQPRLSGIVRLIRITFVILLWFQVLLALSFPFISIIEATLIIGGMHFSMDFTNRFLL